MWLLFLTMACITYLKLGHLINICWLLKKWSYYHQFQRTDFVDFSDKLHPHSIFKKKNRKIYICILMYIHFRVYFWLWQSYVRKILLNDPVIKNHSLNLGFSSLFFSVSIQITFSLLSEYQFLSFVQCGESECELFSGPRTALFASFLFSCLRSPLRARFTFPWNVSKYVYPLSIIYCLVL